MNDLKRLMLNGHSDINYFIKGLTVRDRSQPKVEDIMAVYTQDKIIGLYNASYFADDHFKMIDELHGMILDCSDLADYQEQCPIYCQVIDDATAPCPLIVSNNPLFLMLVCIRLSNSS